MAHRHDDKGGRGPEQEMRIGNNIVTYQRCTCSCGTEYNDVIRTRPA